MEIKMTNKLLVLSPQVRDIKSALDFSPFHGKNLQEIFAEVAQRISSHEARTGQSASNKNYTVFPALFYGKNPENVDQDSRKDLSNSVYIALVDCSVFDDQSDLKSTVGVLWGLLFFLQSNSEKKAIYLVSNDYEKKYRYYFTLRKFETIYSDESLTIYLSLNLASSKTQEFLDYHP
jgi:hypothetical protein